MALCRVEEARSTATPGTLQYKRYFSQVLDSDTDKPSKAASPVHKASKPRSTQRRQSSSEEGKGKEKGDDVLSSDFRNLE